MSSARSMCLSSLQVRCVRLLSKVVFMLGLSDISRSMGSGSDSNPCTLQTSYASCTVAQSVLLVWHIAKLCYPCSVKHTRVGLAGSAPVLDTLFAVISLSSIWILFSKGSCLLCICRSSVVVSSNIASSVSERACASYHHYCETLANLQTQRACVQTSACLLTIAKSFLCSSVLDFCAFYCAGRCRH